MNLTNDEQRALAFIAALLLLSAAVRVAALPDPLEVPRNDGFDVEAHMEATSMAVAENERRSRPLADGERLDPNTAPAAELDRLPGVGPALADRIVEARADGAFRSVADLTRVPGVGERTAERLAPHLTFDAGSAIPRSPRAGLRASGERRRAPAEPVVDVNTADAAALESLPGVGPVLAARIVEHREARGAFPSVDSLVAVPGIGPAVLERIRSRVRAP